MSQYDMMAEQKQGRIINGQKLELIQWHYELRVKNKTV